MSYEQVSKSVVFVKNTLGSNMACIALKDELIFIDTGLKTSIAKDFRKAMEDKFKRKASTLILTHSHIDHFFAMGAFSDLKIIAAEAGKTRFEKFVNMEFNEEVVESFSKIFSGFKESAKEAKLSIPNVWVKEKLILGKEQGVVFQVVGGHSGCSSLIHYLPDGVVITGDLMQVDVYPYFGEPDTDMNKWIKTLRNLEKTKLAAVLPGHGKYVDKNYITSVRTFFEKLVDVLIELKKIGIAVKDIPYHEKLPNGYWPKDAVRKPAYDYSITYLYNKL